MKKPFDLFAPPRIAHPEGSEYRDGAIEGWVTDSEVSSRIALPSARGAAYCHYLEREIRCRPDLQGLRCCFDSVLYLACKQVRKRKQIEPDKIVRIVRI